ncbi:MAG TPA: hypothetical protein VGK29_22180 [Paludibaculum sp.]|jgi:hypothetical protein
MGNATLTNNPSVGTNPATPNISKGNDQNNKTLTFQVSSSDNGTYTLTGLNAFLQDSSGNAAPSSVSVTNSASAGPYSVLSTIPTPPSTGTDYSYGISYVAGTGQYDEGPQASNAQIQVDP